MRNTLIVQLAALVLILSPFAVCTSFGQTSPAKLKCIKSVKVSGLTGTFALSTDGRTLATEEWNGKNYFLKVRNTHTWKIIRVWNITGRGPLALSSDGKTVAISLQLPIDEALDYIPSQINLWDVSSGKLLVKLPKGTFEKPDFKTIVFSPNGNRLATDNAVWNAKTGKRLWSIKHEYVWPSFAFSASGRLLATSQDANYYAADGQVKYWNARTGKLAKVLHGSGGADGPILFSSDGKKLVTSGKPPGWKPPPGNYGDSGYPMMFVIKLWDVRTGKLLRLMNGTSRHHIPVGFLSGNKKLLVEHGNSVNIWDLKNSKLMETWQKPDGVLVLSQGKANASHDRLIAITDNSIDVYLIPETVSH